MLLLLHLLEAFLGRWSRESLGLFVLVLFLILVVVLLFALQLHLVIILFHELLLYFYRGFFWRWFFRRAFGFCYLGTWGFFTILSWRWLFWSSGPWLLYRLNWLFWQVTVLLKLSLWLSSYWRFLYSRLSRRFVRCYRPVTLWGWFILIRIILGRLKLFFQSLVLLLKPINHWWLSTIFCNQVPINLMNFFSFCKLLLHLMILFFHDVTFFVFLFKKRSLSLALLGKISDFLCLLFGCLSLLL